MWEKYKNRYVYYLTNERALSPASVENYSRDIDKLTKFFELNHVFKTPGEVTEKDLRQFIQLIGKLKYSGASQAKTISGLKAFYKFCLLEEIVKKDPTTFLDAPKIKRSLPYILSIEEIDSIFAKVDLNSHLGIRNRAILETLYSSGLRVSELIGLRVSRLYLDNNYIRVIGKGDKERLVPIGRSAIEFLNEYLKKVRTLLAIKPGNQDIVFLSKTGCKLTKTSIFLLVKECAIKAGIKKDISPHTFRHSFATHLLQGGADILAIKDMLGHESVTTTEIYTHLNKKHLRKALQDFHPAWKK